MLSFGAVLFSGADETARLAWRTIPRNANLSKSGRLTAGTIFDVAGPAQNYVTFIGTPLVATVGYCGDSQFVERTRDASAGVWSQLASNLECAFVAFNEEPIPRFLYFEGTEAPQFDGNKVVGTPLHRDWMMHISREEFFKRKILRNIYPINIFGADYLSRLLECRAFADMVKTGQFDVCDLSGGRYGFFVEPHQKAPLFESLSAEGLVVEEQPLDAKYFSSDVRTPRPTLFPVYELFEGAKALRL